MLRGTMIIYENADLVEMAKNYNATYAADAEHYSHKVTFEAIDHFLTDFHPTSCIDIGCGQGQVLTHVANLLESGGIRTDRSRFIGVDVSSIAIRQSEQRSPKLCWVVDTYQKYLASDDFSRRFPGGVDFIINKGGLTFVESEDDYVNTLERTRDALSERGKFLFIKNRKFYRRWSETRARGWGREPRQIMFDIFGEPKEYQSRGYHILLFNKKVDNILRAEAIEFTFDDGSMETRPVYFDLKARPRAQMIADRGSSSPSLCFWDMRLSPAADINVATAAIVKGYPNIEIRGAIARRSSSFTDTAAEIASSSSVDVVFGGSLEDWLVRTDTKLNRIDIDEFTYRMEWLFGFLRRNSNSNFTFVTAFPASGGSARERNGLLYSSEAAEPYKEVIFRLGSSHGIRTIDATPSGMRMMWKGEIVRLVRQQVLGGS